MMLLFTRYFQETDGANAIEYGLLAAGIAVSLIVAIFLLGGDVSSFFEQLPGMIDESGS